MTCCENACLPFGFYTGITCRFDCHLKVDLVLLQYSDKLFVLFLQGEGTANTQVLIDKELNFVSELRKHLPMLLGKPLFNE